MDTTKLNPILNELRLHCNHYALYLHRAGEAPVLEANYQRFPSASLIKVPILLAWTHLERCGEVSRDEWCNLDDEPQVQGAGFAWFMTTRRLTYHDVLLMMIATSDNLCTNLVIRRVGLARLNQVFVETLGLSETRLERRLMDFEARQRGLENWIGVQDCIRLFHCIRELQPEERVWIEPMLLLNQDDRLLKRNLNPDNVTFYHKTGSVPGLLHDWGYTPNSEVFLLTDGIRNERRVLEAFGALGEMAIETHE
jgi:beta-lactamase class A